MFWTKSREQIESVDKTLAEKVVSLFRKSAKDDVYTFPYLIEKVRPVSPERLALVLSELVSRKRIDRIVRVESRKGGGIGDYHSVTSVPSELYDRRIGQTVEVEPGDIHIYFSPHAKDRVMEETAAE